MNITNMNINRFPGTCSGKIWVNLTLSGNQFLSTKFIRK